MPKQERDRLSWIELPQRASRSQLTLSDIYLSDFHPNFVVSYCSTINEVEAFVRTISSRAGIGLFRPHFLCRYNSFIGSRVDIFVQISVPERITGITGCIVEAGDVPGAYVTLPCTTVDVSLAMRNSLAGILMHELDESLLSSGIPIFDPHR